MNKTIEMVCTMNEGRSPVAQFVGQNYLLEQGLHECSVISSGSGRESSDSSELQSNASIDVSNDVLMALIDQWMEQNLFNADDEYKYVKAVAYSKRKELERLFLYANKIFKQQERYFRADAVHNLVEQHGMTGYLKADSHQTMVQDDVWLILCMGNNNTRQVREIYSNTNDADMPKIVTLSEFATGVEGLELPNAFGQWQDFYYDTIEKIQIEVPQAIEKYLSNR